MSFKSKNSQVITDKINYDGSNVVVEIKAEFSATSAILKDSAISAGKEVIFAVNQVSCSGSTITAPHIYISNEANFANCKLKGEVHRDEINTVQERLTPQVKMPTQGFLSSFNSGSTILDNTKQVDIGNVYVGQQSNDFPRQAWVGEEMFKPGFKITLEDSYIKTPTGESCYKEIAPGFPMLTDCGTPISEHSTTECIGQTCDDYIG